MKPTKYSFDRERFAKDITEKRSKTNLSMARVAMDIGIARMTLSRYENAQPAVFNGFTSVCALCDYWDLDPFDYVRKKVVEVDHYG